MARIELRDIHKTFESACILRGVSLQAEEGEFLVLVGPSGCGKSTLLRIIAGLETASAGEVWIGARRVDSLPPRERDVAMVFQSYALYPHMTVAENMGFALSVRGVPSAEKKARVDEVAALLGLSGLLARFPKQLSGGQRQRVAMGRALARSAQAYLFDEPLSNLDATLRGEVRIELKRIHHQLRATMVYVTHDQVEAMTLATRIAVLRDGVIAQVGPPAELYARPRSQFVGSFIGSPPMNFLDATVERGELLVAGAGRARIVGHEGVLASAEGRLVRIGIRPHDLRRTGDGLTLPATVEVLEPLGAEVHGHTRVGSAPVTAVLTPEDARGLEPGSPLALHAEAPRLHLFDAATQLRL